MSVIIPAYNEEQRLPASLEKVAAFVCAQSFQTEVIVVDDGSRDRTAEVAEEYARGYPFVSVIRNKHRGKGCAVKTGMLAGNGEYLFLCDADLSMPIEQVLRFLPPERSDYGIAIGSREALGARRYGEPGYRHFMGRVFNLMVRWLAVPGFQDTQCGFKSFRRDVARDVFSVQTMDGFGFDVEVLFIARCRGYQIVEVPIDWYHVANSRVSPIRDTVKMFRDVLEVRWNGIRGRYCARA